MLLREKLEVVQINLATLQKTTAAKVLPAAALGTVAATERLLAEVVKEIESLTERVDALTAIVNSQP